MRIPSVSTAAEQEAERRYWVAVQDMGAQDIGKQLERAFVAGTEWALEQYRELLEAAEAYRDSIEHFEDGDVSSGFALTRLLAAAAALPGGTHD